MYKVWNTKEEKIVREFVKSHKHPAGPINIHTLAQLLNRTYGSARGAIHREMKRVRELDLR